MLGMELGHGTAAEVRKQLCRIELPMLGLKFELMHSNMELTYCGVPAVPECRWICQQLHQILMREGNFDNSGSGKGMNMEEC